MEHDLLEIGDISSVKRIDIRSADILEVQGARCRSGREILDLVLSGEGSAFDGKKCILVNISGRDGAAVERTVDEPVAAGVEGTEINIAGYGSRLDQIVLVAEFGVALDCRRRIGADDRNGFPSLKNCRRASFRTDGAGQTADIDSAVSCQKRIRILEIVDGNGVGFRGARGNRTDLVDVSTGNLTESCNISHRSGSIRNQNISGRGNGSAD